MNIPQFIVLEGIDGCGKSSQILRLADSLRQAGLDVLTCRDPGTTPAAASIREILLNKHLDTERATDLLLYTAARLELYTKVIAPALEAGQIILCDRFVDSTIAYQGYGREQIDNMELIYTLHDKLIGRFPDLTVLLDIPVEVSRERMCNRGGEPDKYESMNMDFFNRVRGGYLDLADINHDTSLVVDGTKTEEDVHDEILMRILANVV